MKVTYSNSYDRSGGGYVANIQATEKDLSVALFHQENIDGPDVAVQYINGETISEHWAGKKLIQYTDICLSLDEIIKNSSWQDRSVWTGTGRFLPDILLPPIRHTKLWHNVTAETINNKVRPTNYFMQHLRTSPLDIGAFLMYVPFRDSNFLECSLHILSKIDGVPHLLNGEPIEDPETDPMQAQFVFMPTVSITGPTTISPDGKAVLDLQLLRNGEPIERNCEIYLDAIGGYLPQKRIRLDKGKGQARVMALGLESGETIRVKAGFKFWTGDSEHQLEVA